MEPRSGGRCIYLTPGDKENGHELIYEFGKSGKFEEEEKIQTGKMVNCNLY